MYVWQGVRERGRETESLIKSKGSRETESLIKSKGSRETESCD